MRRKVCIKKTVSHVHYDHSANALKFLHIINTHYNQTTRKQIFKLFGGNQTEIISLKHATLFLILIITKAEITISKV